VTQYSLALYLERLCAEEPDLVPAAIELCRKKLRKPSYSKADYVAMLVVLTYVDDATYSDKHTAFHVNKRSGVGGSGMTQYGRALHELGIEIMCANTPAAKGRVERAHGTLQDRLVKEMRLEGISSIPEVNAWIDSFLETYNARFPKPPALPINLHRPLIDYENLDIRFDGRDLGYREFDKLTHTHQNAASSALLVATLPQRRSLRANNCTVLPFWVPLWAQVCQARERPLAVVVRNPCTRDSRSIA
jgi:hypothetical protein